jgi:hypothetical protein
MMKIPSRCEARGNCIFVWGVYGGEKVIIESFFKSNMECLGNLIVEKNYIFICVDGNELPVFPKQ